MDPRAIDKAKSRLRVAKNAISSLEGSKTYGEFSDNWYVFLTSSKNIYTVLEQGAKISPQSRQWFGSKQNVRRSDELLQYIYEARNDDEHGLGSSIDLKPEKHEIGVAASGASNSVVINGGPFINCKATGFGTAVVVEGGPPPANLKVTALDGRPVLRRSSPATAILIDVTARGNRTLNPPKLHLGVPIIDSSPLGIAKKAADYLEALVVEAETKV